MKSKGEYLAATTIDMSGCGALVQFDEPAPFAVGDRVTCEFKIPQEIDLPLPYWGVGNVVRVQGCLVAIDLKAGGLCHPASSSGAEALCESDPPARSE